ncbi:MAG: anhydro-N-acetylmuramic acid kinase [Akkermansiaceae bacterium]|nr:anhydro-N-acetylmuramic acid kinase [Armatimonadota bacterium]
MNPWQTLFTGAQRSPRYLIGLMSGTSADGTDAALVRFENDAAELVAFAFVPFAEDLRDRVLAVSCGQGNAETVSRLSVELAVQYADAVQAVYSAAILPDSERVLAIGCHGQTVSHTPHGAFPATLQLGDAATLATRTGIPVVSNFRSADIALGGQGAPLVPFADWRLLAHPTKTRVLQNIGGIANVTFLVAGGTASDVRGFDTGPGNMLIDHLAGWATGGKAHFDEDGAIARLGTVRQDLMDRLFDHPFLQIAPPKSAGREEFGTTLAHDIEQFAVTQSLRPADVLATATAFTAYSIASAYDRFLPRLPDEVIVSGGGARNPVLMRFLREKLATIPVLISDDLGINAEAREAIAFAVLADATLSGLPASLPAVTGASCATITGGVTLPG